MKPLRKKVDGRFILYPCLIVFSLMLVMFNNIYCFVAINILLIATLALLTKFDIKNPVLLWTAVFILYQISYPILNSLGVKVFEFYSLNDNYYLFSWIATASFLIFYGSLENISYSRDNIGLKTNIRFLRLLYFVLSAVCVAASLYIIVNGFQSKYELANSSDFILNLGNMAYTALIILPAFFVLSSNATRKEKKMVVFATLAIALFGMFTYGERSYVFNYLLIMLLCYFALRKITVKKLLIVGIGVIVFFSASSSMKMMFANDTYIGDDAEQNILVAFLDSDFASAGFNFNYLLNNDTDSVLKGRSYVYDFLSPVDGIVDLKKYSSTRWYTDQYWKTRRTGLGFSIIGEGYVNFGVAGIILQMLIVARLIKFFYLRSDKNGYYFVIYVGLMALSLYSCRQALGNIISPWVKYYIVMAAVVYFANRLALREKVPA